MGLAVAVLSFLVVEVALGQSPTPPVDKRSITPPAPRTDPISLAKMQETVTAQNNAVARSHQDDKDWLDRFNASGIDPRSFRRVEGMFEGLPPPKTIDDAVRQSQLIVSGSVVDVKFVPNSTIITFAVAGSAKGASALDGNLNVIFPGGVTRDAEDPIAAKNDPSKGVVLFATSAPLLLKGDMAVLMLQHVAPAQISALPLDHAATYYYPLSFVGVYPVSGNNQLSVEEDTNPFAAELRNKTPEALMQLFAQKAGTP
jgi:hypothetical protein